jgi:hypothetical protein
MGHFTPTRRTPDLVTVCTSPGFVNAALQRQLLEAIEMNHSPQRRAFPLPPFRE